MFKVWRNLNKFFFSHKVEVEGLTISYIVFVQTIHMVGFGDNLGRLPKFGRVQIAIIDFRIKTN